MSSTKCEGLSYPTHFLKSRGRVIRNNFLEYGKNKPHFLRDEMIFMHCSLQIKQKTYSIDIFRAPVVTRFIVKILKKSKKGPFLKVYYFSISLHFPNVKMVVVQAVIA